MPSDTIGPDQRLHEAIDVKRPAAAPPKTVRWVSIVGLLLLLVLGALYGFNAFRQHAIKAFFAAHKPPPAVVAAATVKTRPVPRSISGIGSLAAVRQVTVSPEVSGRVIRIFFKAGASVKAGDPLVQLNDAPDRADLANYQAQEALAKVTLARSEKLAARHFSPQATVDQDKSKLAQVEAEIEKTRAIIAQKLIRAPFAGQLGIRQVELGQYLTAGAPVVSLTDLSRLYVNFTLPSQARSQIAVGQRVSVTADAFAGRAFPATVTTIEPQLSAATRTLQIQATMHNPDNLLLPGMFVNAAAELAPRPDTMVLPATAVDYTLYGDSVYVIRAKGKDAQGKPVLEAVRVAVETGKRWDDKVAILKGLKPGDRVVAAGQVKLHNGARVVIAGGPPQAPAQPSLH